MKRSADETGPSPTTPMKDLPKGFYELVYNAMKRHDKLIDPLADMMDVRTVDWERKFMACHEHAPLIIIEGLKSGSTTKTVEDFLEVFKKEIPDDRLTKLFASWLHAQDLKGQNDAKEEDSSAKRLKAEDAEDKPQDEKWEEKAKLIVFD